VVTALLEAGPVVEERRSRYGDQPAVFLQGREIAHLEGLGRVDLRITREAWSTLREQYADDPAVIRDPGRRDWVELELARVADVERVRALIEAAATANHTARGARN
jgi:hypothetical protein